MSTSPLVHNTEYPTTPSFTTHEHYKEGDTYLGDSTNYILAALDLCLALPCIALNVAICCFHRRNLSRIVPLCFACLAASDALVGIGALLHGVSFLFLPAINPISLRYLLGAAYFLCSVAIKVSVFLSVTLAVIRTISILWPFRQPSKTAMICSVLVYTLLWLGFACYDTYYEFHALHTFPEEREIDGNHLPAAFYNPGNSFASVFSHGAGVTTEEKYRCGLRYAAIVVPYILPAWLSALTMVAQVVQLNKPLMLHKSGGSDKGKVHLTTTILLLTSVFFLCNSAGIAAPMFTESCDAGQRESPEIRRGILLGYVLCLSLPFLNSTVSPLIMICRAPQLRAYVLGPPNNTTSVAALAQPPTVIENVSVQDSPI